MARIILMAGEARILRAKMTDAEVFQLAADTFGDMFKLAVDTASGKVAAGGALHAQGEELLLEDGAEPADIWGANYFPRRSAGTKVEHSALINIRPTHGNSSQQIQSAELRQKVVRAVENWVGPS